MFFKRFFINLATQYKTFNLYEKITFNSRFRRHNLSASTGKVVKKVTTTAPKKIETKIIKKKTASADWSCVRVSYDCGTTGWACGGSTLEIIMNAWDAYDIACPN